MRKRCKKCGSIHIKKDGKRCGKQSYKCLSCKHIFQNNMKKQIQKEVLRSEFCSGKQTYQELANKYLLTKKTVQKYLDQKEVKKDKIIPQKTVLLIDTTYFGREYGIMVFRSYELRKNIYWKEVKRETKEEYLKGIQYLQGEGREIQAIVCDGKRGLLGGISKIPTQMCHFHQSQIIRRYLTRNPKMQASKELKEIVYCIGKFRYHLMQKYLEDRYRRHKEFLSERNENNDFMHKNLRKAYRSLKNNLYYLYQYEILGEKIQIPKTTNALESVFSHLKQKLGIHRGLKKWRKLKLIDDFLQK